MRLSKILWCSILNHFYQKSMKLLVKIAKKVPPPGRIRTHALSLTSMTSLPIELLDP